MCAIGPVRGGCQCVASVWMGDRGQCSDSQCSGKQFFTLDNHFFFLSFQHEHVIKGQVQHVVMQGKKHLYALRDNKKQSISSFHDSIEHDYTQTVTHMTNQDPDHSEGPIQRL